MPTIAYQLYCSRAVPLERTLAMLEATGLRAVEGYGALYDDPEGLRVELQRHGLRMPSGHMALEAVEADPQKAIAVAEVLGMDKVFVPWIAPEQRGTDLESWRAFAGRVARALGPVREAGFIVGWHNHDFDLADLGGGVTATDLMVEAGLDLELDLGWVARSGQDPVAALKRFAGRMQAVQVKDLAPAGTQAEDGWADVGHGTQALGAIVAELKAQGIDHWVLEHDNPDGPGPASRRPRSKP
jgi:sugar phosphate isomerase/epimerase